MSKVGIMVNYDKPDARVVLDSLVAWLERQGISSEVFEDVSVRGLDGPEAEGPSVPGDIDFLIVLGGDGTLLNAAKAVADRGTPLVGVNMGHLGFLTEIEVDELLPSMERFLKGEYFLDERLMLEAAVVRRGEQVWRQTALNDVVVAKGPFSRLIQLETFVGDIHVETYPADGLIISTPTGSTAYSLSAGGPIVTPELDVLLITPICPHTLYARSLVVSKRETVRVRVHASTYKQVMITIDGQRGFGLEPGDEVVVAKSERTARLMRQKGWNFYEVLRRKLKVDRPLGLENDSFGE